MPAMPVNDTPLPDAPTGSGRDSNSPPRHHGLDDLPHHTATLVLLRLGGWVGKVSPFCTV